MFIYYTFVFVIGLAIGSFLNVCIYRIPRGESIVKPPSHCTNCGTRLKSLDLVPLLSYIFLRGKCRYCSAGISVRYSAVELLTAVVFSLLFYRYSLTVDFAFSAFLMSILIAVFFIDIEHRIIPNGLVITGMAGGVLALVYNIFNPVLIYGDRYWWNPLLGMVTGMGLLLLVFLLGALIYKTGDVMGMGDVKIFALIGIFLGWKMTLLALFLSVTIAGITGLFLIVFRLKDRKSTISFGPFIAISVFVTTMWGLDILKWYFNVIKMT